MRMLACCLFLLFTSNGLTQPVWEVPRRSTDIHMDGFLEDWRGIPHKTISLDAPAVRRQGEFGADDLEIAVQALWDEDNLYLAVRWKDDIWDIESIQRNDAVWVTPQRRRRDRMLFFDYLKFRILRADYDYLLWLSPRISGQGPFMWQRLLAGLKGMEAATSPPLVIARDQSDLATLEVQFPWRELRLKPDDKRPIPLTLLFSDSDLPGSFLEGKLQHLKWLEWNGSMQLRR